jgi:radical SAM protein with 4Fe4S-binding SPASM domain
MLKSSIKRALSVVSFKGQPVLLNAARSSARKYYALRGSLPGPLRAIGQRMAVLNRSLNPPRPHLEDPYVFARMQKLVARRPLDLNIETTNFCAASCVFCPNSKVKRVKSMMDMELFKRLIHQYAHIGGGALGISSMQSDLFSDKHLLERLKYVRKFKDVIAPYSTTYLVGASKFSDDDLKEILGSLKYLQISLGGIDRDSYRAMYGVNGFDTARTQLLRIKRIVEENKLPIKLSLLFRTQNADNTLTSSLVEELGPTFAIPENRNTFFSWGGIISQSDLPTGAELVTLDNREQRVDCAVAQASMSIGTDGTVVGCGCVDWNARHVIGNVEDKKITSIWQGKEAIDFRTAFSRGDIPDLCKDCSLYVPIDKSFSRPALRNYVPTDGLYYEQT